MAFGPPGSDAFFADILPASIGRFEAWHPNFGDCLFVAIERLIGHGHTGAVVLNSDSPTLPTALLVEAAEVLGRPATAWCWGRRPTVDIISSASRRRTGACSRMWRGARKRWRVRPLERAAEIGLDVHMLPAWYDVDDAASLRLLKAELCDGVTFASGLIPIKRCIREPLLLALLTGSRSVAAAL